jgi:hypothetical protein
MQDFLAANGIKAVARYNHNGSMKRTWHLYGKNGKGHELENYQKWTPELYNKLTALGFTSCFNEKLDQYHGNGGVFSVSVRGHYELLEGL